MKKPEEKSRRGFLKTGSMLGLAVALGPRAMGDVFVGGDRTTSREDVMNEASGTKRATEQASGNEAIRPFHFNFPASEITELHRRVNATRWPDKELVKDSSQGVQFATMQKLARYWTTEHDWSKCEARMKALPHFITNIDGLDIHFIHVKSKNANAMPMIITHGWPGSIIEQMKMIEPLTNPTAHGGTAADAFDVVIPSLPGYGFSGKPTRRLAGILSGLREHGRC